MKGRSYFSGKGNGYGVESRYIFSLAGEKWGALLYLRLEFVRIIIIKLIYVLPTKYTSVHTR